MLKLTQQLEMLLPIIVCSIYAVGNSYTIKAVERELQDSCTIELTQIWGLERKRQLLKVEIS